MTSLLSETVCKWETWRGRRCDSSITIIIIGHILASSVTGVSHSPVWIFAMLVKLLGDLPAKREVVWVNCWKNAKRRGRKKFLVLALQVHWHRVSRAGEREKWKHRAAKKKTIFHTWRFFISQAEADYKSTNGKKEAKLISCHFLSFKNNQLISIAPWTLSFTRYCFFELATTHTSEQAWQEEENENIEKCKKYKNKFKKCLQWRLVVVVDGYRDQDHLTRELWEDNESA